MIPVLVRMSAIDCACCSCVRYYLNSTCVNLSIDNFLHLLEIIRMIGGDIDDPASLENPEDLPDMLV